MTSITPTPTARCLRYEDLREILATRPDIDALLIATGDRWHAQAAILAMRAGKDVYSEKPSCMTVAEEPRSGRDGEAGGDGQIYQDGAFNAGLRAS